MVCTYILHMYIHVHVIQGFIQDFELGGGEQDCSRMIVACVPTCTGGGVRVRFNPVKSTHTTGPGSGGVLLTGWANYS